METTGTPTPVYALWHGGNGYALGYVDTDVERFDSREDALAALRSRYVDGDLYEQAFPYLSRPAASVLTPGVTEDSTFTFWDADPRGDEDPYSDDVVTVADVTGLPDPTA